MRGERLDVSEVHMVRVTEHGTYGRTSEGWYAAPPGFHAGLCSKHTVTEHDDGTVTMSPSLLIRYGNGMQWHGYLEAGVWRELADTVRTPRAPS